MATGGFILDNRDKVERLYSLTVSVATSGGGSFLVQKKGGSLSTMLINGEGEGRDGEQELNNSKASHQTPWKGGEHCIYKNLYNCQYLYNIVYINYTTERC